MKNYPSTTLLAVAACIALSVRPAKAQVARAVVEEATEQIFKQAGREGVEQLGEMGGKAAVREMLQQSSKEGGEQLVKKVTQYGLEEGPAALRVIGRSPAKMVAALDEVGPGLRSAALGAVERNPSSLTSLIERYGSGALEAAARHPGVGEKLVATLGSDGIPLARTLTTDESILLARHADEVAALAGPERAGVLSKVAQMPQAVLGFLESHPNVLKTAAGVAVVMAIKGDVIGDRGHSVVRPDGTVVTTPPHPGLIERLAPPVLGAARQPVALIGGVAAVGLGAWLLMHLAGTWRLGRLRYAAEAVRLGRKMDPL